MKTGLALWAGSELSHQEYVENVYKAESNPSFKADASYDAQIHDKLMHIDNGVAVIHIAGSLVDGSAGYGVFYGITGYNDIRSMLAMAVADPEVRAILLNISSGGGAVNGCHEASQLISRVDKIKPVVTYTGSSMASAALWLGSQARYIVAGQTATVGSLGILMVHIDRTAQLAQDGIKATIIRSGSEKALSNPYEALTDKAKAVLQAQSDSLYAIFLAQVASGRGVTAAVADSKFGQGQVFLGKDAKSVGLVDTVGTYEDAMAKAQSLMVKKPASIAPKMAFGATNSSSVQALASDKPNILADNQATLEGISMPKQSLSNEQLVAMAAGVTLDEAPAEKSAEAVAAEALEVAAKVEADAVAAAAALKSTEIAPVANSEAVSMLQSMLATANLDLVTARMAEKAATDALATVQTQANSFTEIARASVRTMGLHFGISAESAAAMTASEVLSEHTRLAGMFQAKFKAGGVAATSLGKPEADASAPTMTVREQQIAMKLPRAF